MNTVWLVNIVNEMSTDIKELKELLKVAAMSAPVADKKYPINGKKK